MTPHDKQNHNDSIQSINEPILYAHAGSLSLLDRGYSYCRTLEQ